MNKKGVFITFEGPEGSGKSTHARLLASWLKSKGRKVLHTREPGGTALGRKLRRILLRDPMDAAAELLLYEASRAVLVREVIRPALKAGKMVILDRFYDSTWVYQGWAGGVDLKLVEHLNLAATGGLRPDRTLVLDLPARKGLARVREPNRFEAKPVAFHEKVRRGYLALARKERRRIRVVRADRPVAEVQREIRKVVNGVLR